MPGMPELMSKGLILEKLDARYKNVPIDELKNRLDFLKTVVSLKS